jgi:hypothetical protein
MMPTDRPWTVSAEAVQKSWARFLASLSSEQARSVAESEYFELTSNKGNTRRIFTKGYVGNTQILVRRFEFVGARGYCAHIRQQYQEFPLGDHLLAQALMITTDEEAFLDVAY